MEVAAPRPDRGDHVVLGGRAEEPDRTGRRLLDRFEQRVRTALRDPVGVLDDDHLVMPHGRAHRGPPHQHAHLVDADAQLLRTDDRDVGMRPRQGRTAAGALRSRPVAHSNAAANARAAFDRPDPGGPVINQAWLIACASPAAARWSTATAASWPTSSCHTVTMPSLPYSTDNSATALDSAPPARRGATTRPAGTACRGRCWPLDAAGLPSAQRHDNVNGDHPADDVQLHQTRYRSRSWAMIASVASSSGCGSVWLV